VTSHTEALCKAAFTGRVPNQRHMPIREAARRINRDVKAVHGDVRALLNVGVLRKTENELVVSPFDVIHVECRHSLQSKSGLELKIYELRLSKDTKHDHGNDSARINRPSGHDGKSCDKRGGRAPVLK